MNSKSLDFRVLKTREISKAEKPMTRSQKLIFLSIFPITILVFGLFYDFVENSFTFAWVFNYVGLLTSPTSLLTDFIETAGVAASCINAGVIGILNIFMLRLNKMRLNGLIIAAFFMVLGFCFFGINLFNVIPLYMGWYVYAKYHTIPFKNVLPVIFFSTALSPLISFLAFGGEYTPSVGFLLAILVGMLIGFVIVPLSSHNLKFHDGYNLYNVGFSAGFLGLLLTGIFRSFGLEINLVSFINTEKNLWLMGLFVILMFILIGYGLYLNPKVYKSYTDVFMYRGRSITDFTALIGYSKTFVNMGIMGLLGFIMLVILGVPINGPTLAALFTVVGFSSFGKHPKNAYPLIVGAMTACLLYEFNFSDTKTAISILFATALSPIAGSYGVVAGMIAGALHISVVTNVAVIHGGINLFNNGFSCGLVAGIFIPIIDSIRRGWN